MNPQTQTSTFEPPTASSPPGIGGPGTPWFRVFLALVVILGLMFASFVVGRKTGRLPSPLKPAALDVQVSCHRLREVDLGISERRPGDTERPAMGIEIAVAYESAFGPSTRRKQHGTLSFAWTEDPARPGVDWLSLEDYKFRDPNRFRGGGRAWVNWEHYRASDRWLRTRSQEGFLIREVPLWKRQFEGTFWLGSRIDEPVPVIKVAFVDIDGTIQEHTTDAPCRKG